MDTTDRILRRSTNDAVALRAANSIFERTGLSAQRRGDETQTLTRIVLTVEQSAVLLDALRVGSAILAIETGRKKQEEEDDDSDAEGNERKPSDQDDEDDEDEEDEETWRT